jgi:hypothetical protein
VTTTESEIGRFPHKEGEGIAVAVSTTGKVKEEDGDSKEMKGKRGFEGTEERDDLKEVSEKTGLERQEARQSRFNESGGKKGFSKKRRTRAI